MKFKQLTIALLILLTSFVLISCNKDKTNPHDPDNIPEKLVIWINKYWAGEGELYIREMMDLFEEQNENNIKVEIVLQQDINTKLKSAMRSGEQVDIVVWDRWETSEFAEVDYFLPLDDYITKNNMSKSDFVTEALNEMIHKDKVYGLPLELDPHGIFVNTNAVEDLPFTWDELITSAQEATIGSGGNYSRVGLHLDLAGYFSSFIQTAGGQMLSGQNKAGFNSPAGYNVLKYWQTLFDSGIYKPGAVSGDNFTANDPFLNGKVAMRVDSLLNASSYYDRYKADDFDYTFVPIPKGPSVDSTGDDVAKFGGGLLGGYGLTIFNKTKYAYHSFELLKWWAGSDENMMKWHDISGYIPARQTILDSETHFATLSSVDKLKHILPALEQYKARPRANGYSSVENAILTPKIKSLLEQGLFDHYDDPIQQCLDEMEKAANSRFNYGL